MNLGNNRIFQGAVRGAKIGRDTASNVVSGMRTAASGRTATGKMAAIQNRLRTKPISTGAAMMGTGAMGAGGFQYATGMSKRGPGVTKNMRGNIPRGIYDY